jgi:predicted RNase H-related nuclease YkuK (DUF458 family)
MKKFKTFDGEKIDDILEYVTDNLIINPNLTVSVGCDSAPGKPIIYVVTVMLYDSFTKKGASVAYYKETDWSDPKNSFNRLQKESELALETAEYLHNNLSTRFIRKDLNDFERKRYKYHLLRNAGHFFNIDTRYEDNVIRNLTITEAEKGIEYKFVDIHVDFNAFEGKVDRKGNPKNRSNLSYKAWVPYLRSLGYRVFVKPSAVAASSAADILLH